VSHGFTAEVMARQGFDALCIDLQHGTSEMHDVSPLLQAISQTDTVPVVRVAWNPNCRRSRLVASIHLLFVYFPRLPRPELRCTQTAAEAPLDERGALSGALLLRVLGVCELLKAVRDNETTPACELAAF
jgi:hypothetical protein